LEWVELSYLVLFHQVFGKKKKNIALNATMTLKSHLKTHFMTHIISLNFVENAKEASIGYCKKILLKSYN